MRIGRVANDHSNFLEMLVADGVGKGKGIIAEIGGCGVADVFRLGTAFVVPEHYRGKDDADAEAALDRTIAEHPTTSPKLLGTVDVKSGVLLLRCPLEKAPKLDAAKVKKAGVVKTAGGCAISVAPGKYDVWREVFRTEPKGIWGTMSSRVRVVPAGTKLTKGEPIMRVGAAAAAQVISAGARRLLDAKAGWFGIQSIAVAKDGRLFAGELGRYGVAAWGADGELLWTKAARTPPKAKPDPYQNVHVQLVGDDLFVGFDYGQELVVLDAKTGQEHTAFAIPKMRAFRVVGDRIVLRTGTDTTVLSYPDLKQIAMHEDYVNRDGIATSRDGTWLVVHGPDVHLYDGKVKKLARTVKHGDDATAVAFGHDGLVITGDGASRLGFWDPTSGKRVARVDVAPERSKKPPINTIATSARHIAAARDDGTVVLVDAKTRKIVRRFEKHVVALVGTAATRLDALAFSEDGNTLFVGAGTTGEPIGATAYSIE